MAKKAKATTKKAARPMKLGLHEVVRLMKMLADNDLMDDFATAATKNKAFVRVDDETVSFARKYLVRKKLSRLRGPGAKAAAAMPVAGGAKPVGAGGRMGAAKPVAAAKKPAQTTGSTPTGPGDHFTCF